MNDIGKVESWSGSPEKRLAREEWDFSTLRPEEVMPALLWEMNRESDPGQVKDGGKMDSASAEKLEAEFGADISLLLKAFARPWLCLPEEFRRLMANSYHYTQANRIAGVVSCQATADGGAAEQETSHKSDSHILPRQGFEGQAQTISLRIDWSYSRKRILARMAGILKRLEPANRARMDLRGRKDRDTLVALERVGIMRLLHHYRLSEIKRVVPEAWHRYKTRKWYHDRRRVLQDFRAIVQPREPEAHFPRSWRTKAKSGWGK